MISKLPVTVLSGFLGAGKTKHDIKRFDRKELKLLLHLKLVVGDKFSDKTEQTAYFCKST